MSYITTALKRAHKANDGGICPTATSYRPPRRRVRGGISDPGAPPSLVLLASTAFSLITYRPGWNRKRRRSASPLSPPGLDRTAARHWRSATVDPRMPISSSSRAQAATGSSLMIGPSTAGHRANRRTSTP
jgi:hypothetical protein